ncbi:MAG TPA: S8 family serine peptidase, partial [Euzebya sp.]|nr:S8 family serine peptidase [Euzebya sp.]
PDLRDRLVPGFSATGADERVDGHGHGTHVAGTAAASLGGGYGVAGLAPEAAIMPVQVTDADGLAYASDVAEGLIWAVDTGATVANMSLAGTSESLVLNGAIDYAVASGVVVVVAAGNEHDRGNPRTYPASHPDVIAVGSLRDATTRSAFSSTGDWLDLAAPGSSIISTRPDGTFGYASGTSMAAPLVAGAVALVRSAAPDLASQDVRALLLDGARDLGSSGWDEAFGHGALDVMSVLDQLTEAPSPLGEEAPSAPDEAISTTGQLSRVDGLFSGEGFHRR